MSEIHIIAEAGVNHNGDIQEAIKLVDIAKRAQADSVKFQIINPWGLYLPGNYKYGHYKIAKVIEMRKSTVLSDQEYNEINEYSKQHGIPLSASVFDTKSLNTLLQFSPPYVKIASCDLNNIRFLREVAQSGKKMILSTGMSSLMDIEKSLNALSADGFDDVVLLHCVSIYPAKLEQTNLGFIETLQNNFGKTVGFSDHTPGSIAACMALVKGATWFEKHYTQDRTLEGFDHAHALEEEEFTQYIKDIRSAHKALQSPDEKISDAEHYTRQRARRSLYASKNLIAGETITDESVLIVRPQGPVSADCIDDFIGKILKKDIGQHEPFTFAHIA